MVVTTGQHDQSGANHSGTRKSTWATWTVEGSIARTAARKAR